MDELSAFSRKGGIKYAMMYYLNGINAIVHEWLKDGCNKPVEEVSNIISGCIYGIK